MSLALDLRLLTAAAIGCSVGLWMAYAGLRLSHLNDGGSAQGAGEIEDSEGAWVLAVSVKFASEAAKQEFVDSWRDEAEHVRKHEPGTLAYELLQSDKDPLQAMIFERYRQRSRDYLEVHKTSPAFLSFREKMARMQQEGKVKVDGHSFVESGIGFMQRNQQVTR